MLPEIILWPSPSWITFAYASLATATEHAFLKTRLAESANAIHHGWGRRVRYPLYHARSIAVAMVFAIENLGSAIALCLGLASHAPSRSYHARIHAVVTVYVRTNLDIAHVILPGAE